MVTKGYELWEQLKSYLGNLPDLKPFRPSQRDAVQAGVRTVGTRGNLATMAEFRPRPSALPNFIQELSSTKALQKRGVRIKLFNQVQQSN